MATKLAALCVCIVASFISPAWATDQVESAAVVESESPDLRIEPRISPRIARRNREQIAVSFEIARERVLEVPQCSAMFTELVAEALGTLSRVSFYPIGSHELKPNVCDGIAVHTLVGGGPIWVCRKFSRLSDSQAAMVIIHEALHHAGLTEQPHDANGITSGAINDMVLKRCGL